MFELIEEDVIGGCTRGSEAEPEGIQPLKKALYSYSTQPLMN
jgi:hypothetical protein